MPKIKNLNTCIFLILSIILFSCKSKRQIISTKDQVSLDIIKQDIFNAYHPEWIAGKAKIKVSGPLGSQKATMFLRSKKDSVIWTVFKKLSIEGARSQITADSIYIVNRLEKYYQQFSIDTLKHMYGMVPDLHSIQDLIAAHIPEIDTTKFWEYNEDENHYNFRSAKDNLLIDFSYDKFSGLQTHGKIMDGFLFTAYWQYENFKAVNDIMIPFYRKYSIEFNDQNFINIILEFSELEIDKATNIRFNIPQHYNRIN